MPELDVPVASYDLSATVSPDLLPLVPASLAWPSCVRTSTVTPFDDASPAEPR